MARRQSSSSFRAHFKEGEREELADELDNLLENEKDIDISDEITDKLGKWVVFLDQLNSPQRMDAEMAQEDENPPAFNAEEKKKLSQIWTRLKEWKRPVSELFGKWLRYLESEPEEESDGERWIPDNMFQVPAEAGTNKGALTQTQNQFLVQQIRDMKGIKGFLSPKEIADFKKSVNAFKKHMKSPAERDSAFQFLSGVFEIIKKDDEHNQVWKALCVITEKEKLTVANIFEKKNKIEQSDFWKREKASAGRKGEKKRTPPSASVGEKKKNPSLCLCGRKEKNPSPCGKNGRKGR